MKRVIKKYANRKLYDTETSKPITLPEIAALIAKGDDIQVIDNETGEDLTTITLSQIILEQEKHKGDLISVPILLQELIRRGRSSILEFMERSILASVEAISLTKERAEEIVNDLIRKKRLDSSEGERLLQTLLSKAKESKQALQRQIEEGIKKVLAEMDIPSRSELLELKKNIAELNQKLDTLLNR